MRIFILVVFWVWLLEEFCKAILISNGKYPRKTDKSSDVLGLIINAAFLIWAGHLLWY